MTSLHEGHKAEERLKCIDNMLFKKCEDTKDTILQAFWWYRKHSISLAKVKQAREEIANSKIGLDDWDKEDSAMLYAYDDCLSILNKLIESEE